MAIPNEALQKLLAEIEREANNSTQQITLVKSAIASRNRESRKLQLTSTELNGIEEGTNVYEGVGRFFIQTSKSDVMSKLNKESKDIKSETVNLEKKLLYLETTAKNSRGHIERLLAGRGGGS